MEDQCKPAQAAAPRYREDINRDYQRLACQAGDIGFKLEYLGGQLRVIHELMGKANAEIGELVEPKEEEPAEELVPAAE